MGAIILSNASRPHHTREKGAGFTQDSRLVIHWDGSANRKQNSNLANGVVWVDLSALIHPGNNLGFTLQSLNAVGSVAVGGSMLPGRSTVQKLETMNNAEVTACNATFEVLDATLTSAESQQITKLFSILRLTFVVNEPATVIIGSM